MAIAKMITLILSVIIFLVALRFLGRVVGPLVSAYRLGPKGEEHPSAEIPGWGGVFDAAGDCTIQREDGQLRIEVPPTLHDLSVEQGQISAPRLLSEVEGDFIAEVTVGGRVEPQGDRTSSYAQPYHGAGLLLWLDRDNYIRLERAAIRRDKNPFRYVNFEQRSNANMAASYATGIGDGPIDLRLERRGSTLSAAIREGSEDWVTLPNRIEIRRWGTSLRVGVVAINTATDPFVAEFHQFRVNR